MSSNTIQIIVDDLNVDMVRSDDDLSELLSQLEAKSVFPAMEQITRRTVDVSVDILKQSVDGALQTIFEVISYAALESEDFEVSEIRFSLQIQASGEVSLLSVASGTLSGHSGLEFSIIRRRK